MIFPDTCIFCEILSATVRNLWEKRFLSFLLEVFKLLRATVPPRTLALECAWKLSERVQRG